ncbi:MAG: cytochrome c biogenesis protein CcdA [Candidatus Nanohaloarchaea archaeon]|nr:cytochrome c biogenesis protein CcdA [Candidatus Nanohaloarchaea archaeon]
MGVLADLGTAFVLGLLTPLTAACVLPLYPGFLTYITEQLDADAGRTAYAAAGIAVAAGVVSFMVGIGIVFTTILQVSLTSVVEVVSPAAFALLGLVSIGLIADVQLDRYLPQVTSPSLGGPLRNAFSFGLFFGAIVLPCNPGFIAAFFIRSAVIENPVTNILGFIFFGAGIGAPLLAFSLVSMQWSSTIIAVLTRHRTRINRTAGVIMLAVSLYYIVVVFQVAGPGAAAAVSAVVDPILDPVYSGISGLIP